MYKKKARGKKFKILQDDLEMEVYLPPVGFGYDPYTGKVDRVDTLKRSPKKSDQYWEIPSPPPDYKKRRKVEQLRQSQSPDYVDPALDKYRIQEWHRRKFGIWFMNNGKATYLTGGHYMYLVHWLIDIGHPDFRMPDLEYFYFVDYIIDDPFSMGGVEVCKRRAGKTYRSGLFLYDGCTRNKQWHSGIQSKTDKDAKKNVFAKAVVQPFKKLPHFFMPEFDKSHGATPSSELRFFKTTQTGRNAVYEYDPDEELESWIDYESSKAEAYDGKKLQRYVADECFKTADVDIWERHQVIQPCLKDDQDRIIGKALYTSTVEDMGNANGSNLKLWKNSDQTKRNRNGRTISGMYRFFMPAYKTLFINKYGIADEERAKEYYLNEREDLMDDPRSLASYIRKFPFTWQEAFRLDNENSIYNTLKLSERADILKWKDNTYERFNLVWENGVRDSKVIMQKNAKGRFYVAWVPENEKDVNRVRRIGSKILPNKQAMVQFSIGIDPYDHDFAVDGRGSMAAAAVYRKLDPSDELFSDNFTMLYHGRPAKAVIFYEDMIKLCFFLGSQMLFENQKQGIRQYFEDRGYEHFMSKPDGKVYGIAAGGAGNKSLVSIMEYTEAFIEDRYMQIMFPAMIDEWIKFDPTNTKPSDIAMATGYALIHANMMRRKMDKNSHIGANVADYVRKFKMKAKHAA